VNVIRSLALILLLAAPLPACLAATTAESTAPMRKTMPNGIRLICVRETATPLVAIDVFVRAPAAGETVETAGLGTFVARTLLSSTKSHVGQTIQFDINALGGNVTVTRQPEWIQLSALTVSDKFVDAAALVTDVMKNADFDPDAVNAARGELLEQIDSDNASVINAAYANLLKSLYPNSGIALPAQGTPRSVKRMTRAALVSYFKRVFVPGNMVVVVVGNVAPEDAIKALEDGFDDFPASDRKIRRYALPEPPDPTPLSRAPQPIHQQMPGLTEICAMVGFRAPSPSNDDYPAALVLNALLGGMKSSRLFTELREKQGLSYELGSFYTPRLHTADLAAFAFARPTKSEASSGKPTPMLPVVTEQLLHQIVTFKTVAPTDVELARAKHFVIGSYKIKHERLEDRAALLGAAEIGGKDGMKLDTDFAEYIDAVTIADVQRVAKKYLAYPAISTVEPTPDTTPGD
jgi:zinc protease